MKNLLLPLTLFVCLATIGQPGHQPMKGKGMQKLLTDSALVKLNQAKDSVVKTLQDPDPAQVKENIGQNMDYFFQLQKEQRAKQKKAAIIRIVFGLGLLVVLVIGLRRRRSPSRNS